MITFKRLGHYGRFGNQMFQYATLYSIAKTKKYLFGVPYKNRSSNEYHDFCLPDCFLNLSAADCSDVFTKYKAEEKCFTYNPGICGIIDDTDITGYFQSEKYFMDYRNDLLKEYSFADKIKTEAENIRSLTKNNAISVHIRLGDYIHQQHIHPVCNIEYYKEALEKLPDDLLIYVFSDDNEQATKIFNSFKRKIVIPETNNKFIDMCLMSLCDYHVIANSSFSWWGSWLSNSKKTIAPSKWFGADPNVPKNWSDIYCDGWYII